jgi:hypothetical protein
MTMLPQLREDRVGRGSNHKSFVAKAIPGVHFIDVNENPSHQHSPNDLFVYVTTSLHGEPHKGRRGERFEPPACAHPAAQPGRQQGLLEHGETHLSAPASGLAVDHYVISARSYEQNFYGNASLFRGL